MRNFVIKIIALIVLFFGFDYIAGIGLDISHNNTINGDYFEKKYILEDCDSKVVIFGACEAESGIISTIIEDSLKTTCWNTATAGQTFPHTLCLEKGITKRYIPDIAVFVTNEDFLSADYNKDEVGLLRPFYRSHEEIRPIINKISLYEKFFNFSRLYSYNSSFYNLFVSYIINKPSIKIETKGWKKVEQDFHGSETPPVIKDKIEKLNNEKISMFNEFVNDLSSKGCKVFVVIFPIYNEIVINSSTIEHLKNMDNVQLLDFYSNNLFVKNHELYSNEVDLNTEGATKFTNILVKKIKEKMAK